MRILKLNSVNEVTEFLAVCKVARLRGRMGQVEMKMAKTMISSGVNAEGLTRIIESGREFAESCSVSNDKKTAAMLLASVDGDSRLDQIAGLQEELSRLMSSLVADYSEKAESAVDVSNSRAEVMSKVLDSTTSDQY